MIACHNPDDLRKSIIPILLKQCKGMENSAKYHADEAGIIMMNAEMEILKDLMKSSRKKK